MWSMNIIQEYCIRRSSSERGTWILFKGNSIKDVDICSVDDVVYATFLGSGESYCKIKLKFTDPSSGVFGKTFKLTLPELVDFPDFLVERSRYDASIERKWTTGDKCFVWWRNVEGGGNEADDVEPNHQSSWELHPHKDTTTSQWEQPPSSFILTSGGVSGSIDSGDG
ncbi:unnamed protein product [Lactuca virosa]|uniref:BRWD/PHIP ancillary-like domain-containing protein n=1 Tax=Lactuca virosa TaxID=75947 RepID=A0AAU9LYA6_9ASTR|nr:unnamed protein product [Lactuca virosa]